MKPIDVQDQVLLALDTLTGRTVTSIHRSLTTTSGQGPTWREACSAVIRLERQGLVFQHGDELIGVDVMPTYALTAAGGYQAAAVRQRQKCQAEAGEVVS